MRKINNRKKTGAKLGIAKFGAGMFYIKTTGMTNKHRTVAVMAFEDKFKIPHKEKVLNAGELGRMEEKLGGAKLSKIVITIDQTSKEFRNWAEETTAFSAVLELALSIDGEIKAYEDENGKEQNVWANLKITKNSYVDLVDYLLNSDKLAMEMDDVTIAQDEITKIKSRGVFKEIEKTSDEYNSSRTYAEIEIELEDAKESLELDEIKVKEEIRLMELAKSKESGE